MGVGLGDGPWDSMQYLDDNLEQSRFDNFQFVEFAKFQAILGRAASENERKIAEAAFQVCALQELPAQYAAMDSLGFFATEEPDNSWNGKSKGKGFSFEDHDMEPVNSWKGKGKGKPLPSPPVGDHVEEDN